MKENFWENFEKIDNEKIVNEKLDNKQEAIALWILKVIDVEIPDIDIDLAYDKKEDNYYILANNKALNIPIKLNNLPKFWSIMTKLFNKNIQLFWDLTWRKIAEDTWMIDWLEKIIIKDNDFNLSKNDIEEIFTFVMKSKNIPIQDWKLESTICKWWVNQNCKEALWN